MTGVIVYQDNEIDCNEASHTTIFGTVHPIEMRTICETQLRLAKREKKILTRAVFETLYGELNETTLLGIIKPNFVPQFTLFLVILSLFLTR